MRGIEFTFCLEKLLSMAAGKKKLQSYLNRFQHFKVFPVLNMTGPDWTAFTH